MRTLIAITMAASAGFAANPVASAADAQCVDGVLVDMHQQTIADTSMDPSATTIGQFFRDYPHGAPGRVPMVPTKEVVTFKVRKANGVQVEIMQDLNDSKNMSVGDKVLIERVDGKDRVVPAD